MALPWQPYVDTQLVGSDQLDKAAIYDATGQSLCGISPGYEFTRVARSYFQESYHHMIEADTARQIAPDELKKIVAAFSDPSDVLANGFYVAKERFVVILAEDDKLYGKKGREGVVISKTKTLILIGHYPETVQPGNATNVVERLKDYLVGQNC